MLRLSRMHYTLASSKPTDDEKLEEKIYCFVDIMS